MSSEDPKAAPTVSNKAVPLASTQRGVPPASGPSDPGRPTELSRLGRFEIRSKLGEGGMGEVLLATDPQLGRRVALKVLRREIDSGDARRRLLREAQGVAQLTHDNVIVVHEVGTHDGQDYIAMEYVAGATLTKWQVGRPWQEIVEMYLRAGRGLAAAHDARLVHRDFKPDNVLVGDDGRVRVSDFGLVAAIGETPNLSATDQSMRGELELAVSLTRTGSIMGTPRYMPAEQHLGQPVDARADQFAFCAALYEALFGHPPFVAETYSVLVARVLEGEIEPIPADHVVPAQIRDAIVRGLARKREDRFPSMRELLGQLVISPVTPVVVPRRWVVPALAGVGLLGVIAVVLVLANPSRTPTPIDASPDAALTTAEWETRARKLAKDGNFAGASEAYEHAIAQGASNELLFDLLNSYANGRNCPALKKAYERYHAALANDPARARWWEQNKLEMELQAKTRVERCIANRPFEIEESDFAADGTLTGKSRENLDALAMHGRDVMTTELEIRVFVGTGDPAMRQAVADRRAKAVVAALVDGGFEPDRVRGAGIPRPNSRGRGEPVEVHIRELPITFDSGDRLLTPSHASLDRIAGWLQAGPSIDPVKIEVELAAIGGDPPTRKRRANARAEVIRDYLTAKGLAAGRFEIHNTDNAANRSRDSVKIHRSRRD